MELSLCHSDAAWDAFVNASPQGSVFCRSSFLKAIRVRYQAWFGSVDGRPELGALLLLDDDGNVCPAPFGFSLYHGILFSPALTELPVHSGVPRRLQLVESLLQGLEERYTRLSFCLHPTFTDTRGLSWFHYHEPVRGQFDVKVNYTGWVDLNGSSDFASYLAGVRKVRRYEYSRALRSGMTVAGSHDVDLLLELYRKTFARQGMAVDDATEQLARGIAAAALAEGFGELLVARTAEGQPASAALFLFDDNTGYYLIGANDPAYRDASAGTCVVLEGIRQCQMRGLRRVDVCGMNSPARGDFKASLNALPVPYFTATWDAREASDPARHAQVGSIDVHEHA